MFDRKSDYALNKKEPDAVVYKSATGVHTRLTRADFASEEEFLKWKEWSDEDYHATEKADHAYYNHRRALEEYLADEDGQPEENLIEQEDELERQRLCELLSTGLDECLTETQRRRLWMYYMDRLTLRQIAVLENVNFQKIANSIQAAKRKIQKFLTDKKLQ